MLATHIVFPKGLANRLARITAHGQLEGVFIKDESLFVVLQGFVQRSEMPENADANGRKRKPIRTRAWQRVREHQALVDKNAEKAVLPFVVAKKGVRHAFLNKAVKTIDDLSSWTEDGGAVALSEIALGTKTVCVLERQSEGIIPYTFICDEGQLIYHSTVEIVPVKPEMPTRMDGLSPVQALRSKTVAVIGLGSGGSMATLSMAAAGVGTLHLFDRDRLSVDNVFRHACNINHVGRTKVHAMHDLIASHQLPTKIVCHENDVVQDARSLWNLMPEFDLVVCATDNAPSRRLANYICVHTNTPLLLGCAFHNAHIGEIIRVIPGRSACYECTRSYLRGTGALQSLSSEEIEAEDVPYNSQQETILGNGGVNTGTRVDVSFIASLLARAAITTLLQKTPAIIEPDLPCDYFTWGVNLLNRFPEPFAFELPFSINWMPIARQSNCLICTGLEKPYDLEIEKTYASIMESVSGQNPDDATSGKNDYPLSSPASQ